MKTKDTALAHELAERINYEMFKGDPQYELCDGTRPAAVNRAQAAIAVLGLTPDEVADRLGVLIDEVVDKHIHSETTE